MKNACFYYMEKKEELIKYACKVGFTVARFGKNGNDHLTCFVE